MLLLKRFVASSSELAFYFLENLFNRTNYTFGFDA
jgi:hypothetical protein